MLILRSLLLVTSLSLIAGYNAYAADAVAPSTQPDTGSQQVKSEPTSEVPQTHFRVLPPKIKPVQTGEDLSKAAPEFKTINYHELESLAPREGFGTDFWKGTDYDHVVSFLKSTSPPIMSSGLRHMMVKATITPLPESNTGKEDLYSLRLAKLVSMGAYADALALYKMNEGPPPSPIAARAGVEAMVGSGQMAVACLEQKALAVTLQAEQPDLWSNLSLFCQSLFSPSANVSQDDDLRLDNAARVFITANSLKVPSHIDELNGLSPPVLLAHVRSSNLNLLLNNPQNLSVLQDKTLAALIASRAANPDIRFSLLNEGLRRGLVDDALAKRQLALPIVELNHHPQPLDKAMKAPVIPSDKWANFLKLYNVKEFQPNEAILSEVTKLQALYLLALKADAYASAEKYDYLSAESAKNLLILLLKTNHGLPTEVVTKAFASTNTKDMPLGEQLLTEILMSAKKDDKLATAQLMAIHDAFEELRPTTEQQKTTYDNLFSLTPSGNYVMPMGENLSSLQKSADKKLIGQVVIDSINVLSEAPLDTIHPAALFRTLQALDSAGLNEETVSLARDVLGDVVRRN